MKSTILNWRDELIVLYEWDESGSPIKARMTLIWAKPGYDLNWPQMEETGTAKWPDDGVWDGHPWQTSGRYWQSQILYDSKIVTISVPDLEKT